MRHIAYLALVTFTTTLISACGGGSDSTSIGNRASCTETGPYACQTGATEPLYTYQWALNATQSYFAGYPLVADGTTDLNVEAVHAQGIKGQGVNVMVLDDGLEINHIDLKANINPAMTWNFQTNTSDPTPSDPNAAHGTNVAGMIAAAQNGIGVMGIAPRVTLGGAKFIGLTNGVIANAVEAYGGALWSKNTDVFNASYGISPLTPSDYSPTSAEIAALQSFPNLRNGKGAVMVKSAGNDYVDIQARDNNGIKIFDAYCPEFQYRSAWYSMVSCANASSDSRSLELPVIIAAAANAKGYKSSYSSAGSVVWITGLGGEGGSLGNYGEEGSAEKNRGPQIYSSDLMGCDRGYSKYGESPNEVAQFLIGGSPINQEKNSSCDFSQMNGTSSSAPTVTGVVALMLSANPNLGWRDIRDILRRTARQMNPDYGNQDYRNHQVNLTLNPTLSDSTSTVLTDGATAARIDYGWQTNGAGKKYSNWYGFGLVDAKAAVAMAKAYTVYKSTQLVVPTWSLAGLGGQVKYGEVKELGKFSVASEKAIDMIQLAFNASKKADPEISNVCMGSVGIFLKSPQGSVSVLSTPYNVFYDNTTHTKDTRNGGKIGPDSAYVLGSYAFYGENPKGDWTIYAVSGTPLTTSECAANPMLDMGYRIYNAE
jgi:subtilisin family serine protease